LIGCAISTFLSFFSFLLLVPRQSLGTKSRRLCLHLKSRRQSLKKCVPRFYLGTIKTIKSGKYKKIVHELKQQKSTLKKVLS
jgi:hypothetical protein